MLIRAGYEIEFDLFQDTDILTQLNVRPEYSERMVRPESLQATVNGYGVPMRGFLDDFGNQSFRLHCPPGRLRLTNDFVISDSGRAIPWPEDHVVQHAVRDIPDAHLLFLLPSRYCESDKLSNAAWSLFGHTPLGWPRVKAVVDWVHHNVIFGYQYASKTKTAVDVFETRQGVCRDFAHLAITFCRALNIPARYATGYLGDIGVPYNPAPMDFSACFEVFLGGKWWLLDARHNQPRIGWVLMSRGRDAADCAITTAFGNAPLVSFKVWTSEEPEAPMQWAPPSQQMVQATSGSLPIPQAAWAPQEPTFA